MPGGIDYSEYPCPACDSLTLSILAASIPVEGYIIPRFDPGHSILCFHCGVGGHIRFSVTAEEAYRTWIAAAESKIPEWRAEVASWVPPAPENPVGHK